MLKAGERAPNFEVPLASGGHFRLADQQGRNVILFFYPRAFSYGCTAEVGGFCTIHDRALAENAVVIGVSTDSVERLREFGEALNVPFALGSDASGEIRRLYNVRRRFGLGTSRVTYVIDDEGIITGVFHNEIAMSAHARNALAALEELT